MASPMITIKMAVIVAMFLFVKSFVPIVVEFYLYRFPNLWSSLLSWLKPPYLFIIINVIIVTTIVASSKYFQTTTGDLDCEEKGFEMNEMDGSFVAIFPLVTDVEKEDDEAETEKPLVLARFSHRKPVKVTSKGNKRKEPNRPENMRKMMWLANHSWRSESLRFATREETRVTRPVLRELETFRDMTNNYPMSPTVTRPVNMRKEVSPSLEELNRQCEAFIKKGKEEMLESLILDNDVDLTSEAY
ncbi:unnamed protein product [Eruca vesicaria subsp. sativa]|uniref:DUF4408 domain-containing protein n=1 Tax=Eruca vesicaria subsp. sativa TaxID=29727 RepID=A0ABC8L8X7_ERUVS|nr:unnamed protein product [Eruca vesicaria subsp. sativa]